MKCTARDGTETCAGHLSYDSEVMIGGKLGETVWCNCEGHKLPSPRLMKFAVTVKAEKAKIERMKLDFSNLLRSKIARLDELLKDPRLSDIERRDLESKRNAFALEMVKRDKKPDGRLQ